MSYKEKPIKKQQINEQKFTCPCSFPTLLAHAAVLAAVPCNFLTTFLVESTFRILPNTLVREAFTSSSRDMTSRQKTLTKNFRDGIFRGAGGA
jgi:hypothetical protein